MPATGTVHEPLDPHAGIGVSHRLLGRVSIKLRGWLCVRLAQLGAGSKQGLV